MKKKKKKKEQTIKPMRVINLKNGRDLPRVTLHLLSSMPEDTGVYQVIFVVPTSKCDNLFGLLTTDEYTEPDHTIDRQLTLIA